MGEEDQHGPPITYANSVQIDITVYDFGLTFGHTKDSGTKAHTTVRMSPQHAKSLLLLLERFIVTYEQEIAPITLPDQLIKRLKGETNDAEPPN